MTITSVNSDMNIVEYVNGVCVLNRNMHPVLLNRCDFRERNTAKLVSCAVCLYFFCLQFPLVAILLTLSALLSVCFYEWIPQSVWPRSWPFRTIKQAHINSHDEIKFEDCEKQMSEISIADIFFHLTKVKVSDDVPTQFQITVTYRTHRWHTWRTFSDFENVQKQLKIDFPTYRVEVAGAPSATEKDELVRKQALVIVDWLGSVIDVHIICNHIDVRKIFGLPVYEHSNRYGSMYVPPHVMISRSAKATSNVHDGGETCASPRATPPPSTPTPPRTPSPATLSPAQAAAGSMSHLSPTISSLTHGMGFLSAYTRARRSMISTDHVASNICSTIAPSGGVNKKHKKVTHPIRGTNWLDVEFTDQTVAERAMYRDLQEGHKFLVRGPTYMTDRKKILTGPAVCRLVIMELYEVDSGLRHDHIASMGLVKDRVDALNSLPEPPELYIINFQIPGDPPVSIVSIFAAPPDMREDRDTDSREARIHKHMWRRYMDMPASEEERLQVVMPDTLSSGPAGPEEGDVAPAGGWKIPSDITWDDPLSPGVYPATDFKNTRFKLIPTVTEGNWMVRAAVPSAKPALLGQKLQQRYFRGRNYVETDVDVGSSVIASQIVGVLRGYAKHFTCDVGIVLQGEHEEELPERMLACIVINKVDIDLRRKLFGPSSSSAEAARFISDEIAADKAAELAIIHGDRLDE